MDRASKTVKGADTVMASKIGAVIVAAGMSSRMGQFKPLMKIGDMTMTAHICIRLRQAGVSDIVVVTGHRAQELETHIADLGVTFIRNENYETTQMFDSAKLGFEYIADRCDRIFFTPADIPLFAVDTLKKLAESGADVVRPICGARAGHPILLSNETVKKLLLCACEDGLRGALAICADTAETVAVDDEGILLDADTQSDFQELVKRNEQP